MITAYKDSSTGTVYRRRENGLFSESGEGMIPEDMFEEGLWIPHQKLVNGKKKTID